MQELQHRQPIKKLSLQLANQIAAGEVVERPASVIKELLENSLDSGATQIDIEVSLGGTQLIRVRDNGMGIPQQELVLALSPHATSKIKTMDDLIQIHSMGFRGEALASIDSVSALTLTSRTNESEQAWSIKTINNERQIQPASHAQGTTVEVNNLFFNTPARRKFLRSDRTEYRHLEDVVKRIAMANFNVAINLKHNRRQILSLAAAKTREARIQRLKRLLGQDFLNAAIEINFENAGLHLWGWIASPAYSRSQSDMQYFFVNGRMIRDKVITHAVRQAYQENLYPGRFPVFVLHLEMDAEQVDVNVHPTKHEVRFHQTRLVHDFLFHSLYQALKNEPFAYTKDESASANPHAASSVSENNTAYPSSVQSSAQQHQAWHYSQAQDNQLLLPLGKVLTVIDNKYLVTQTQDGMMIVNLKGAQNISLQAYVQQMLTNQASLVSQPVLIPYSVRIKVNATTWLETYQLVLGKLGFDVSVVGENELMVRQLPVLFKTNESRQLVELFLQNISLTPELDFESIVQIMIDALCCDSMLAEMAVDFSRLNTLLRNLEELNQYQEISYSITAKQLAKGLKSVN